ncbi:MAG: DUF4129 domain-containing protein [Verrucomicrobiota bacterium]|jgi:hypothetical protein
MVRKPTKTLADHMVIGISPVLIMLLVGSLSFFLIEALYRGAAVGSVRWVLFWFVLAVVLVSRIGIEQGTTYAAIYGLALAVATWLYLVSVHPAALVGAVLLGIVWWSAHKVTWDCTLIDDAEDASGSGLLQTAGEIRKFDSLSSPKEEKAGMRKLLHHPTPVPHAPGLWVVYFSLVALPLFGIGQMLLPSGDTVSRRAGFVFLFVYLAAAVGLLLTTSFLGLRRYLRQRYLPMPGVIAFGWLKFGAGVAVVVFLASLLLPRPGVNDAWATLHYQIDYRLRQASDYAMRLGPHGSGQGRAGHEPQHADGSTGPAAAPSENEKPAAGSEQPPSQSQANGSQPAQPQTAPPEVLPPGAGPMGDQLYVWFRNLLILAGIILAGVWLFKRRHLLLEMARSLIAALTQFFRDLFDLGLRLKKTAAKKEPSSPAPHPFAAYTSPFLTGKDKSWTVEEVVLYSYEALQAWAVEQGIQSQPEQTAREFCLRLGQAFPDAATELDRLAFLYGHAAYGFAVPAGCDLEPVRKLWHYLSATATGDNAAFSSG